MRLVEVALRGFGGRSFDALADPAGRAGRRAARPRGRVRDGRRAARPTPRSSRLGAKLSELYGRQVSLKVDVDPAVLGGVSVRVGSDLYDGTVLRRLNEARNALAKQLIPAPATATGHPSLT